MDSEILKLKASFISLKSKNPYQIVLGKKKHVWREKILTWTGDIGATMEEDGKEIFWHVEEQYCSDELWNLTNCSIARQCISHFQYYPPNQIWCFLLRRKTERKIERSETRKARNCFRFSFSFLFFWIYSEFLSPLIILQTPTERWIRVFFICSYNLVISPYRKKSQVVVFAIWPKYSWKYFEMKKERNILLPYILSSKYVGSILWWSPEVYTRVMMCSYFVLRLQPWHVTRHVN